jgi:hypothetical protein
MTTKDKVRSTEEALKLALEALEGCEDVTADVLKAITAIREALAEQPAQDDPCIDGSCSCCWSHLDGGPAQQEPVAWKDKTYGNLHHQDFGNSIPLYTSPPASKPWVGLTDEEKSDLWCESTGRDCVNEDTHVFADAIEAKLKEKNDF